MEHEACGGEPVLMSQHDGSSFVLGSVNHHNPVSVVFIYSLFPMSTDVLRLNDTHRREVWVEALFVFVVCFLLFYYFVLSCIKYCSCWEEIWYFVTFLLFFFSQGN